MRHAGRRRLVRSHTQHPEVSFCVFFKTNTENPRKDKKIETRVKQRNGSELPTEKQFSSERKRFVLFLFLFFWPESSGSSFFVPTQNIPLNEREDDDMLW